MKETKERRGRNCVSLAPTPLCSSGQLLLASLVTESYRKYTLEFIGTRQATVGQHRPGQGGVAG